jgi:H+/Cl- antiporter ClcA
LYAQNTRQILDHHLYRKWRHLLRFFRPAGNNLFRLFLETLLALLVGVFAGGAGVLLYHGMNYVTNCRLQYPWLLFLLPVGGLLIVFLYRISGQYDNKGTNLMLLAVQSGEYVSIKVAPLIFISTLITHLLGGSAGREGAALQLGGSIGGFFGDRLHMDQEDHNVMIMCGMSACFSAVFGTPAAAAVFSMEVISIGIMHYAALVPCVISSFTAALIARYFHAVPEWYDLGVFPELSFLSAGKIMLLAAAFAGISIVFCISLHISENYYKKWLPNPYLRIIVGGCLVVAMVFLFRTRDYIGAGMPMISACFDTGVPWFAFLLKILFTAVTLGAGYKGGEIVPSFFTGATLGCVLGPLLGLPMPLCAACGLVGVFCGVTNCPVSSLLISAELFGFAGMPYFMITIAVCYMLSGYYGLYNSQKIVYSKYKDRLINRNAHH